jgi:hypothetical protein
MTDNTKEILEKPTCSVKELGRIPQKKGAE